MRTVSEIQRQSSMWMTGCFLRNSLFRVWGVQIKLTSEGSPAHTHTHMPSVSHASPSHLLRPPNRRVVLTGFLWLSCLALWPAGCSLPSLTQGIRLACLLYA